MPENESSLAVQPAPFVKASTILGHSLGMETGMLIDTLKSQFFKNLKPEQVSDAQLATVIAVANALKLNPLLPGQLYPYPERSGGVTVMIGPDGIYTLLANNPDIVATTDGGPAWWVEHGKDDAGKETCTAYINHRAKGLLKKTIWVDEWIVASNPNWSSRRKHMGEIRALKQCARQVVHGIPPDMDEKRLGDMLNVTESDQEPEKQPKRDQAPPKAATTGVAVAGEEKKKRGNAKPAGNVVDGDFSMAEKPKEPATTLGDKETKTFVCRVLSFSASMIKSGGVDHPSVKATLDGDFKGNVIHLGGATAAGGKDGIELHPNPAYQLEKPVAITLVGKARKPAIVEGKEVAQHNAILVEAIKLAEVAAPAAPPAETAPAPEPGENVD